MREQGVEANATERAVRGATELRKLDGIYRLAHDGDGRRFSTHMRKRTEAVAAELRVGAIKVEPGRAQLVTTREEVVRGWAAVGEILVAEGQPELATQVKRFVDEMPPPLTEKEQLATQILQRTRGPRIR